jgi:hypothetical protein
MCAAGAKELYPEKWTEFLSAKYAVVCSGDECMFEDFPKGDKTAGLGKAPASGNCSDFKCPAPTMLPRKNVSKDAVCNEVSECEFNCCYVDINADKKARNEILTFATIMALKNVTAIASDLDEELGREKTHDLSEDVNRLKMNVEGLYRRCMRSSVLRKVESTAQGETYLVSSLARTMHYALSRRTWIPRGQKL